MRLELRQGTNQQIVDPSNERIYAVIYPTGKLTTFSYDEQGRLSTKTKHDKIASRADILEMLEGRFPVGSSKDKVSTYVYDTQGKVISCATTNDAGQSDATQSSNSFTEFHYDAFNGRIPDPASEVQYDAQGRQISITTRLSVDPLSELSSSDDSHTSGSQGPRR